jgi:signal transduction histidine kinase
MRGDEKKIRQVMFHLLSNAVKFTPAGREIRVSAEAVQVAAKARTGSNAGNDGSGKDQTKNGVFRALAPGFETAGEWVKISVADTGSGIDTPHIERIFDEFYQVKSGIVDKTPGTGLGLPLARRIVEIHGGRIWAESDGPGKGSVFHVLLPH